MYFGDGAVNDLEDWSNFLEVPDFMASFSSSEVLLSLQGSRSDNGIACGEGADCAHAHLSSVLEGRPCRAWQGSSSR